MGAMKLVQEGQQEEVVADAVGAANDQDPAGCLRRGRQCAATGKPAEQGSLQSRRPDPALAVEAAQGIVEVSHTVGLQCWDGVKGASGLLRQC